MKQILTTLLFFILVNTYAEKTLFTSANNLYTNGEYAKAIIKYDSILSNNIESYEIYYNLGNCYYKIGDWANAIWHYEKSLKFEKNEKTMQNLALTNSKIIDKIEPLPQIFYKKWIINISQLLNTKSWQTLALLSVWIFLIFRILILFTSFKKYKLSNSLFLTSILFLFLAELSYNNIKKKEAIIFSSTVIVNSAPTSNSTDLFSLHAGAKIKIIDRIGDWINIKLINGNTGWIKQNNCRVLY